MQKLRNIFPTYFKNKYFRHAKKNIICDCPLCHCPNATQGKGEYSFTYIREDIKVMYFDVPKAASSSIRNVFFENNHKLSLNFPKKNETKYFKFSFVRNPWDRVISNWKMFTQQPFRKEQLVSMTGNSEYTLEEFLELITQIKNHHWLPQSMYVPKNIDFIGKIEFFQNDMIKLHEKIGIPFYTKIWEKKYNSTKRKKNYKLYFNQNKNLIKKIEEIYEEDIIRFNYYY